MDDKPSDKPDRVSFSGSTKMYLWPKVNFVVFWSFFCFIFGFLLLLLVCGLCGCCCCPNVAVWYLSPINLWLWLWLWPLLSPFLSAATWFSLNSNALSAQLIADYANQMRDICVAYDNMHTLSYTYIYVSLIYALYEKMLPLFLLAHFVSRPCLQAGQKCERQNLDI